MSYVQALLQPLLQDIQSSQTATSDPAILLRLHHLIKAVGNVGHGFPELKNTVNAPDGQWVAVLQEATRIILASLKVHSRVAIIREAVCLHLDSAFRIHSHLILLYSPLALSRASQLVSEKQYFRSSEL